jgi:uncharacterized protein involved in type VI secretion and phage assembly
MNRPNPPEPARFFGKYRGIVSDNQDPLQIGRIRARVPAVLGDQESGWALPCAPFAGSGAGMFVIPPTNANVWIEFENGDPDYPIWVGGFWGSLADLPPILLAPPYQKLIIQTNGGSSILLDDTPGIGGITLETSGGQKIVMTALGIEIDNGQGAIIKLTGPMVQVNNGALEVI